LSAADPQWTTSTDDTEAAWENRKSSLFSVADTAIGDFQVNNRSSTLHESGTNVNTITMA
jgi:hypothetical protein